MGYNNEYLKDEGKILQEDIIDFLNNESVNLNKCSSLQSRLELYLFEFRFMCRSDSTFISNGFEVYLNNNDIDLDKLKEISNDFSKFKIFINSSFDKEYSYINLVFTIKN